MTEYRPTIREIALKCGYSRSTVARALKGDPATKKETRQVVKEWAEKLGYLPDPVLTNIGARAWRRPREMRSNLGYVIASSSQLAPKIDEMIIKALEQEGLSEGYRLEPVDIDDGRSPTAIAHNLYHRGIRGLFFSASILPERLRSLSLERFSVLAVGLGNTPHIIDIVRRDTPGMEEELWNEILERGYRRIGFAMVSHPDRPGAEAEGLMHYLYKKFRRSGKKQPFFTHAIWEPGKKTSFRSWIEGERLDVIVGFNASLIYDLEAEGISVPGEVAFASARLPGSAGRVTGFSGGIDKICHEALAQMSNKLRLGSFGLPDEPKRIMLRTSWVEGETLPRK